MAYSDYLHCYRCGEKALYWSDWDNYGCAHCDDDHAVEVYCVTCTEARKQHSYQERPSGGKVDEQ